MVQQMAPGMCSAPLNSTFADAECDFICLCNCLHRNLRLACLQNGATKPTEDHLRAEFAMLNEDADDTSIEDCASARQLKNIASIKAEDRDGKLHRQDEERIANGLHWQHFCIHCFACTCREEDDDRK